MPCAMYKKALALSRCRLVVVTVTPISDLGDKRKIKGSGLFFTVGSTATTSASYLVNCACQHLRQFRLKEAGVVPAICLFWIGACHG